MPNQAVSPVLSVNIEQPNQVVPYPSNVPHVDVNSNLDLI